MPSLPPFTRFRRAAAGLVVALLVVVAPSTAAVADNPSPTNDAVAVNTHDGSSVFKLAFSIRQITDGTVAPQNAAVAYASCTDCQTVAIAIQVVFVVGSPDTFTPQNVALAVNEQCTSCDTLATAYQFIVQSSVPVRLTNDGRHQIDDIVKALRDLDKSNLSIVEIQQRVDQLMQQLAQVLATEVEPIPGHADDASSSSPPAASDSAPSSTVVTTTSTTTTATSTTTSTTTTTTTASS